jgi:hypothetical protein
VSPDERDLNQPRQDGPFNDICPTRARSKDLRRCHSLADSGIGRSDVIPLWFGEVCWPNPDIGVEAARQALADGDHFYQPNSGKSELREEISAYHRQTGGDEPHNEALDVLRWIVVDDVDPQGASQAPRGITTSPGMSAASKSSPGAAEPRERATPVDDGSNAVPRSRAIDAVKTSRRRRENRYP